MICRCQTHRGDASWPMLAHPPAFMPELPSPGQGTRDHTQPRTPLAPCQPAYRHLWPVIHLAHSSAESHQHRPQPPEAAACSKQAPRHVVPAEGVLRQATGLPKRGVGTVPLRLVDGLNNKLRMLLVRRSRTLRRRIPSAEGPCLHVA